MRDSSPQLILGRLNGFAARSKATTGLDDEQFAQLDLVRRERDAAFFDEPLCSREHAASGEELDGHVRQPLELLLSFDDLREIGRASCRERV